MRKGETWVSRDTGKVEVKIESIKDGNVFYSAKWLLNIVPCDIDKFRIYMKRKSRNNEERG